MSRFRRLKLGATGEFPQGKINRTDEGAIRLAVGHTADGLVRVKFGKPVAWLAMDPDDARELARLLISHADQGGPQ